MKEPTTWDDFQRLKATLPVRVTMPLSKVCDSTPYGVNKDRLSDHVRIWLNENVGLNRWMFCTSSDDDEFGGIFCPDDASGVLVKLRWQ